METGYMVTFTNAEGIIVGQTNILDNQIDSGSLSGMLASGAMSTDMDFSPTGVTQVRILYENDVIQEVMVVTDLYIGG